LIFFRTSSGAAVALSASSGIGLPPPLVISPSRDQRGIVAVTLTGPGLTHIMVHHLMMRVEGPWRRLDR
jgi:hypothetical protein